MKNTINAQELRSLHILPKKSDIYELIEGKKYLFHINSNISFEQLKFIEQNLKQCGINAIVLPIKDLKIYKLEV